MPEAQAVSKKTKSSLPTAEVIKDSDSSPMVLKSGADNDRIPPLEEVLEINPVNGLTYAYVLGKNVMKARNEGFALTPRNEMVEIHGEAFVVMWKGERLSDGNGFNELLVDTGIDELWES